jgi:hypothetical protein
VPVRSGVVAFKSKSSPHIGFGARPRPLRIPQGNSKYYGRRVSTRADCLGSTELKLHARSRLQALQGDGAVLFSLAAGPPGVFSKRFVFELIEDEDG